MSRHLRDQVLDVATLLGTKFSEQTAWQEQRAAEERETQRVGELLKQKFQPAVPAPPTPLAAPPSVPEPRGPQLPVNMPSADGPKAGRNDPCPCGSGRKFKNCCLNS